MLADAPAGLREASERTFGTGCSVVDQNAVHADIG